MGGGWETRRRQGRPFDSRPDWIMIRLGAAGTISGVEVDTNHFKGNFPDRCALDGVNLPGARITDLLASDAWETFLPEQKLRAHEQHMYREELSAKGPYTHVRLSIFPDGGISRLRVLGHRSAGKSS
jgi:allantoicase